MTDLSDKFDRLPHELEPVGAVQQEPLTVESGIGPAGVQSPRRYTEAEAAAARRRNVSGPMFWATGNYYPNELRTAAADYALLSKALQREMAKGSTS